MLSQMFSQNLSLLISNLNPVVLFIGSEPTSGSSQLIRFSQLAQPEFLSRALVFYRRFQIVRPPQFTFDLKSSGPR